MERLVDALASAVSRPLRRVLQAEWIAVPSPGMERWLSMELARRFGVWANPAFPFPRALVESLLTSLVDPGQADPLAYEPLRGQFSIASLLAELGREPEFAQVHHYIGEGDHSVGRRLALARRIADVFDHYVTYRPEMMLGWQAGAERHWQALLFRALNERSGDQHLAARSAAAIRALRSGRALGPSVPERIHLFGLSTLPPLYLDLLAAASEQREINLFVLSPSREYFADLRSEREQGSARRRAASQNGTRLELEPEAGSDGSAGHPLLASLGRHSREFQEVLEGRTYVEPSGDLFEDPGGSCLLHQVQSDMLALRDRGGSSEHPRITLDPADRSIMIHACHSAMREVEVLHDQLLALITEGDLEAHDIIVMTPDITTYAPVIEAVFSQAVGRPRIPFRIADRGVFATHAVVHALDGLLDLFGSRFAASQVLDLLGQDLVRERFGVAVDEVEVLRDWVKDSGIRWGVDAEHRAEVGQPPRAENTWRFGLARLALGYASGASAERMFAGTSPASVDSGDADLLGRFFEFGETLFRTREELSRPAAISQWGERVSRLLGAFVVEDSRTAGEHSAVRHALLALADHATAAGFDEAIDLASFRALLGQVLDARPSAQGFLAGGVTFCQLMPMRSIPFRVVCLLGLHDGAFPASDVPMDFDLLAKQRRPGDRRRRDDDRQLFLEALLSARRNFLITYIGQSIHDGKPLLPSVLVTELIDHLSRGFTAAASGQPRSSENALESLLVTRHALLAVSPRYFRAGEDPRLFSYASWALAGARAVSEPKRPTRPFFALPEPPEQLSPPALVGLAELEECLVRPQRMFAQRQLGLMLGRDLESAVDREPFELDALERWQVASDLLVRALDAPAAGGSLELARARGVLPLGTPGVLAFRELDRQVDAIVKTVEPHARAGRLSSVEVDLQLGTTRLSGSLDQVWPSAQLRVQYSKAGNRHELRHFVRHLALLCVRAQHRALDLPERSLLVGRDKDGNVMQVEFGPLPDPAGALTQLLAAFALAQEGPLPLFENASRAYAAALHEGKSQAQALDSARSRFGSGFDGSFGDDSTDAYVAQFFPSFDAALEAHGAYAFTSLAEQVYGPLYATRRQL